MRISEATDMILSEMAPYVDEALAIMFDEIDATSYSLAEATARKKRGMSALAKAGIATAATAGLGGAALMTRGGRRVAAQVVKGLGGTGRKYRGGRFVDAGGKTISKKALAGYKGKLSMRGAKASVPKAADWWTGAKQTVARGVHKAAKAGQWAADRGVRPVREYGRKQYARGADWWATNVAKTSAAAKNKAELKRLVGLSRRKQRATEREMAKVAKRKGAYMG